MDIWIILKSFTSGFTLLLLDQIINDFFYNYFLFAIFFRIVSSIMIFIKLLV
jgi:hypothetical protein